MKIAHVYDAVYPHTKGGGEKRIYEIGLRQIARGHELHWFGIKWWKGEPVIRQNGFTLHGVCRSSGLYTADGKRSVKEAIKFASGILKPEVMRSLSGKFDVIEAGNFPYFPCFSARFASMLKGTPLVITWHEVWGDYWYEYFGAKGFFGKIVERMIAKLSCKHIAVSEHTKKELVALGVDEEKITVIPNGVNFQAIQRIPPYKESCDVLFAGRLARNKNVDALIEAVSQIKRRKPAIKCRIIGDGPEKERLMALRDELGLKENVEFLGFIQYEDLIANMKSSKLFVLPSTREGFGIVLVEAMASKTPVIAIRSKRSAVSEIITDGKNGVLCEMEDLGQTMGAVLGDHALRMRLAKAGHKYAEGMDWGAIAEKVLRVYEDVISESR